MFRLLVGAFLIVHVLGKAVQQSATDGCTLSYPCTPGTKASNPADCLTYQLCVGPYHWEVTDLDCTGPYSNVTESCSASNMCHTWSCPVQNVPMEPEICRSPEASCEEGKTYPDKYFCNYYYRCVGGVLGSMECPTSSPYYSVELAGLDAQVPCTTQIDKCLLIDYDLCGGTSQDTDPCNPSYPCVPGDKMSLPFDCFRYQLCVAPGEWAPTSYECGGSYGAFSNVTKTCNPAFTCYQWSCPANPNPNPPPEPEPCVGNGDLTCTEGRVIPSKNYCKVYYRCVQGTWGTLECPVSAPYFSVQLAILGASNPCTTDITVCDLIPFETCGNMTYPDVPDACDPPRPCNQGDRISYPPSCLMYQQCVGPHDWVKLSCGAGGPFNNITGQCNQGNPCQEWTCPPTTSTPQPPEPCITPGVTCTEDALTADKYYCTHYHKCLANQWVTMTCPVDLPYYSPAMAAIGYRVPCTDDIFSCNSIPYGQCLNSSGPGGPQNACNPSVPCTISKTVSYPLDCQQFQTCVGPYEWRTAACTAGQFSNVSSTCSNVNPCHEWTCDATLPGPDPPEPGPCIPEGAKCIEGATVPDKYTCTQYYKCYNGEWNRLVCPLTIPYYSMAMASLDLNLPCTDDMSTCLDIPFGSCNVTVPEGENACYPAVPCTIGDQISYPSNCEMYQVCIAPYDWLVTDEGCDLGPFSNATGSCSPMNECHTWSCDSEPTRPPTLPPDPCIDVGLECVSGKTIPDKNYCGMYYKCGAGTWVQMFCPENAPFYSVDMAALDAIVPCTNNFEVCFKIECADISTPENLDACAPSVPCAVGDFVSDPSDCRRYQKCVGPYHWVAPEGCQGSGATFNNHTGMCETTHECHTWTCPGGEIQPPPTIAPAPCIDIPCMVDDQTLADQYYCNKYHKCVGGQWATMTCPETTPYYSLFLASNGATLPCTDDINSCDSIYKDGGCAETDL